MTNHCEDKFATLDDALRFLTWCDNKREGYLSLSTETFDANRIMEDIDDLLDGAVKGAAVLESMPLGELKMEKRKKTSMSLPQIKRRFRRSSCSSTALQRRKKAEIQMLREEAVKLQGYLNQLKNRVCHAGKSADGMRNSFENSGESDNVWRQRSNTEYQERLHSEQTNKRLKQILDHQEKVFKTLSATIKRQQSSYGQEFVESLAPLRGLSTSKAQTDLSFSQLEKQVEENCRNVTENFDPMETPVLYCASQPKYDEQSKTQVIEFVTITPLDCSSEAACDGIWGFIQKQSIPGSHPNTRRKNRNLTMHYRNCVLEFNSIYNIQKFVEHNRIVIAWSGILVLPSQSLQYRTQGYSTITPSKANSTEGCVVRTKATLYREDVGVDSNQHPEITEKAHNIAFGVLSVKIRSFWQTEQMRLVRDSMRCSSAW